MTMKAQKTIYATCHAHNPSLKFTHNRKKKKRKEKKKVNYSPVKSGSIKYPSIAWLLVRRLSSLLIPWL